MNILITPGNTATHYLLGWLGKPPTGPTIDGLTYSVHTRFKKEGLSIEYSNNYIKYKRGYKIHYLMCNPYDYILASFRRGFPSETWVHWREWCCGDPTYFKIGNTITLKEYLLNPYDAVQYKSHLTGYVENPNSEYEFLFTKYESLGDNKVQEEIRNYWGVPKNHPKFNYKERKTSWERETEEIKQLLEQKLGEEYKWFNNLPDYFKLKPGEVL
tara:strand:+ start:4151 stop:4792 length:642 start_codon:yes stop_codon:yes gene_type:complete